ncbi:MAG: ABC transporter permease [Terracidiphilus sp.]|jgi:predicted permease
MQTLFQDVRYGFRQLTRLPGFTLTAVFSLALGIGATTAVFSVVYGFLIDPYPYAAADRMVHLRIDTGKGQLNGVGLTAGQWQQIRHSPVVDDAFLADQWNLTVTGSDLPEDVNADYFSSNAFEYFGVPAAFGRNLQPSDAIDGQDPQPVVVLSYKFWQRHFNSDRSVIGKTMQMVRKNYTVVGVAAPRFTWDDADVYLPKKITQDPVPAFYVGVRLKPGITHQAAESVLDPLIRQFAQETPKHFPTVPFHLKLRGFNDDFLERLGGVPYLLFGAVSMLLLIGCGNVSILLLARAIARNHEFAVRAAIGASRRRIIRQLLTESLLISLTGAALGLFIAYRSLDLIVANLPMNSIPHEAAIHINLPVLLFCMAVAVATGVLFGLWPALQVSKPNVSEIMQAGTRKVAGSVSGRRFHGTLIAGQLALTLLMLTTAGAAIEGFLKMLHMHLGYDPHNIMSVGIPVHEGTYKTWAERASYFERLKSAVAEVPGVTMVAISTNATPPNNGNGTHFEILGRPSGTEQPARLNFVSPEYFPALRILMAQGRIWDQTENHNAAPVVVINQTLAKRYFPDGDAIGHSIKFPDARDAPPFNLIAPSATGNLLIIGVIQDKLDDGLAGPIQPEAFVPFTLGLRMYTQLLVRADVTPLSLLHAVSAKVNTIDHDQQTNSGTEDLEHWIQDEPEWSRGRLLTGIFGAFAVLALVMSAVGLYSVVSYSVVQRTNEFGIRMALGAQRAHVLAIVFRSTVVSVGGGILAGVVLTFASSKLMARWSAGGTTSAEPLLLAGATLVLALVATLACTLPARRAAGVDPMNAIRYE